MEGNFLSRYNNKIDEWMKNIEDEPHNKSIYEREMSDYMMSCTPYMKQYTNTIIGEVKTDNVFKLKETTGLQKKDIFTDYLIDVEKMNLDRPMERVAIEKCPNCRESNLFHFSNTADVVCDSCGMVVDILISEELTYKEEQETSEKIINYSYKRDNHFNEWLSQFQAQEMTTIPPEVIQQLRNEFKKIKIKSLSEITHARVRSLLKKLKLNKLIKVKVNYKQIGSDRLANAISVVDNKNNFIILDFGTATTFDILTKNTYQGGIIAPGIKLSLNTLSDKATLIPRIDLKKINNIIGKDTVSAVRSGFFWGYSGLIDNIINLIKKETRKSFKVIITGGFSNLFKNSIKTKVSHNKNITINGLIKISKLIK